jgi:hypothetical protein
MGNTKTKIKKFDVEDHKMDIKKNGINLNFAPYELKNDKNLVLIAVKSNGISLEFASDELKNDKV